MVDFVNKYKVKVELDNGQSIDAGEIVGVVGETPDITATATVDSTVGEPQVTVTKSGTVNEPEFNFAFSGIKGSQGKAGLPLWIESNIEDIDNNAASVDTKSEYSIAIGKNATITPSTIDPIQPEDYSNIVIGQSSSQAHSSIVIGSKSNAADNADNTIAIGHEIEADSGVIAIGSSIDALENSSIIVGNNITDRGTRPSIVLCPNTHSPRPIIADSSIFISIDESVSGKILGVSSIGIGSSFYDSGFASIGIGNLHRAGGNHSIAIGYNALAKGDNSIAIGSTDTIGYISAEDNQIRIGLSSITDVRIGKYDLADLLSRIEALEAKS